MINWYQKFNKQAKIVTLDTTKDDIPSFVECAWCNVIKTTDENGNIEWKTRTNQNNENYETLDSSEQQELQHLDHESISHSICPIFHDEFLKQVHKEYNEKNMRGKWN